ncbi:hypothetical protein BLOT_009493 [Blomia tropicalis]|nr:hypothetical protein BLOT_009493 [Blomia tropicalis]
MILDYLQLEEQMKLHCVCRRWKIIQQYLFIRQKSLRLIFSFNNYWFITEYLSFHSLKMQYKLTLKIKNFTKNVVYKLINTFPNITSLEISLRKTDCESFENLWLMLNADESFWPKRLVQLALSFHAQDQDSSKYIKTLVKRITQNNLPLLRKLIISTSGTMLSGIDIPIINQLETFYLHTLKTDDFFDSFNRYIRPDNRLTDVRFLGKIYKYKQFVNATKNFSNAIHWLSFRHAVHVEPKRIAQDFPSVTMLNLCYKKNSRRNLSFIELMRQLALFRNLTHLSLLYKIEFDHPFSEFDSLSIENVPVLNNLQHLKLYVQVQSHKAMEFEHLQLMFAKRVHVIGVSSPLQDHIVNHAYFVHGKQCRTIKRFLKCEDDVKSLNKTIGHYSFFHCYPHFNLIFTTIEAFYISIKT